jgi:hypothetical protein
VYDAGQAALTTSRRTYSEGPIFHIGWTVEMRRCYVRPAIANEDKLLENIRHPCSALDTGRLHAYSDRTRPIENRYS